MIENFKDSEGKYVTCVDDGLKYYKKGYIYKIIKWKYNGWSSDKVKIELKMEGFKTFVNSWNFKFTGLKEFRQNKLKILNGEKSKLITSIQKGRKLDDLNSKEKDLKLMDFIFNRITTDKNKLQYADGSVKKYYTNFNEMIETIVKTEKIFGITVEDFEGVKAMNFSDAFDKYIKNKIIKNKNIKYD
jgi:hypothetical protein